MENHSNTPEEAFFKTDGVNECFEVNPRTNKVLLSFMLNAGYKTVSAFAFVMGVSRSRLSQIIHRHIPPDDKMKVLIAKALKTDSRIIFPEEGKNE